MSDFILWYKHKSINNTVFHLNSAVGICEIKVRSFTWNAPSCWNCDSETQRSVTYPELKIQDGCIMHKQEVKLHYTLLI